MSELSFGQIMRRNCKIDAQAGVMEFQGQWYDWAFLAGPLMVLQAYYENSMLRWALILPLCAAIGLIRSRHSVP